MREECPALRMVGESEVKQCVCNEKTPDWHVEGLERCL